MLSSAIMAMVKTLVSWISAGALIGLFAASVIGPKWLGWYNSPGSVSQGALCDCVKKTDEVSSALLTMQVEGAAAGGIALLIIGVVVEVRKRKKNPPAAAAAA